MSVFPCEWCSRTEGCPCITEPIHVRRAQRLVAKRHRDAVAALRESRRLEKPNRRAA